MIRILFVLAALAYGAMPLTGMAQSMPEVAHSEVAEASDHAGHHGPMDAEDNGVMAGHGMTAPDGDCPHPGKSMISGHCAACITLAADILMQDAGPPARSALCPSLSATLTSRTAPPLDPPPRV